MILIQKSEKFLLYLAKKVRPHSNILSNRFIPSGSLAISMPE